MALYDGTAGNDEIYGSNDADIINGLAGDDIIYGLLGDDEINGDEGNDQLWSYGGINTIDGGTGDDTIMLYNFRDYSSIDGGADYDTVNLSYGTVVLYGSISNIEHFHLDSTFYDAFFQTSYEILSGISPDFMLSGSGTFTILLTNGESFDYSGVTFAPDTDITIQYINQAEGALNATWIGTSGTDSFGPYYGLAGADLVLTMGAGADVVDIGSDINDEFTYFVGGDMNMVITDFTPGEDKMFIIRTNFTSFDALGVYGVQDGNDVVMTVPNIEGTITVRLENVTLASLSADDFILPTGDNLVVGGSSGEKLYGFEGNDTINGNGGDDELYGGEAIDVLEGGDGDDLLDGGLGNDTASYSMATIGVEVALNTSGDQDTLGAGTDTLVSIENLTGSEHDDRLTGDGGDNVLTGLGGSDRFYAGSGNDTAFGDAGNDRAWGGVGQDTLYGGSDADKLFGNEDNDVLDGGDGDDKLNGGSGADSMTGGLGDDIFFIDDMGDVIVELADEGTDRVVAGMDYMLGDNIEVLRMRTGDLDGTGNGLDNLIRGVGGSNVLDGAAGDDNIYGGTGSDTLIGGDGIDRLRGEVGSDTLTGGADKDFFIFNAADELGDRVNISDIITDFSQEDGDLINVRGIDADTTTGGDQNFTFIGDAAFSGTAGELRYYQSASRTFIEVDIDGDSVGDLFIRLEGVIDLTAGDFVL